jgi:uncharacterized protein
MLTNNDISRIAARVARGYAPLVVGTFGSYAIGTASARSDLDLFVIKMTAESAARRRRIVKSLLTDVFYPLDIHVFTPEEFEASVNDEMSFIWMIAKQAAIYHWAEGATAHIPSLGACVEGRGALATSYAPCHNQRNA